MSWDVRVKGGDGDEARVFARSQEFATGAPLSFDPEYGRATALEQALGALGADVVNGFRRLARRKRVDVDDIEALVTGWLDNPLTYLGVVGEEGNPGIERIRIRAYVSSPATESELQEIWEEAAARSPLVQTFGSCVALEMEWKLVM